MDLVKLPSTAGSNTIAFALAHTYSKVFYKVHQSLEENNLKYKVVVDKH